MQIARVRPAELDFPIILERTVKRFTKKFLQGRREPRVGVVYHPKGISGSGGLAWPWQWRIRIKVGSDMQDAEHVLLHELTHLTGAPNHSKEFYRTLKQVIKWAGVDPVYSENREARYKPRNSMAMRIRRRNNEGT